LKTKVPKCGAFSKEYEGKKRPKLCTSSNNFGLSETDQDYRQSEDDIACVEHVALRTLRWKPVFTQVFTDRNLTWSIRSLAKRKLTLKGRIVHSTSLTLYKPDGLDLLSTFIAPCCCRIVCHKQYRRRVARQVKHSCLYSMVVVNT